MRMRFLQSFVVFSFYFITSAATAYCYNSNYVEIETTNLALPQPLPRYLPETGLQCCMDYFSGIFFGLDWGYRFGPNELKIEADFTHDLTDDEKIAITANFNLGYGYTFCSFYLGGELSYLYRLRDKPSRYFFDPGSLVTDEGVFVFREVPVYTEIQSQQGVSFDLLPGFLLSQKSLVYARVGIEEDNYTWNRNFTIAQLDENSVFFNSHDRKSGQAYRLGLGYLQAITPHFGVDANFIYIFASDIQFKPRETEPTPVITIGGLGFPANVDPFFNSKNTIRPERFELTIGFRITI